MPNYQPLRSFRRETDDLTKNNDFLWSVCSQLTAATNARMHANLYPLPLTNRRKRCIEELVMSKMSKLILFIRESDGLGLQPEIDKMLADIKRALNSVAVRETLFHPTHRRRSSTAGAVDESAAFAHADATTDESDVEREGRGVREFRGLSYRAWTAMTSARRAKLFEMMGARRSHIVHALLRHVGLLCPMQSEHRWHEERVVGAYRRSDADPAMLTLLTKSISADEGKHHRLIHKALAEMVCIVLTRFSDIDPFEPCEHDGYHTDVSGDFAFRNCLDPNDVDVSNVFEPDERMVRPNWTKNMELSKSKTIADPRVLRPDAVQSQVTFRCLTRGNATDVLVAALTQSYRARRGLAFFCKYNTRESAHAQTHEESFLMNKSALNRNRTWLFAPPSRTLALLRVVRDPSARHAPRVDEHKAEADAACERIVDAFAAALWSACASRRSFESFARLDPSAFDHKTVAGAGPQSHAAYAAQVLVCDSGRRDASLDDAPLAPTPAPTSLHDWLALDDWKDARRRARQRPADTDRSGWDDLGAAARARAREYAVVVLVIASFQLRTCIEMASRSMHDLFPPNHDRDWKCGANGFAEHESRVFAAYDSETVGFLLRQLPTGLPPCLRLGEQRSPLLLTLLQLRDGAVCAWSMPRLILAHRAYVWQHALANIPTLGDTLVRRNHEGVNVLHALARADYPAFMMHDALEHVVRMREHRALLDKRTSPNLDALFYGTAFAKAARLHDWTAVRAGECFSWAKGATAPTFPDCTALHLFCIARGQRRLDLLGGVGGRVHGPPPDPLRPGAPYALQSIATLLIRAGADPAARTRGYAARYRHQRLIKETRGEHYRALQRHYQQHSVDTMLDAADSAGEADEESMYDEADGAAAPTPVAVRLLLRGGGPHAARGVNLAGVGGFFGPTPRPTPPPPHLYERAHECDDGRAVELDYDARAERAERRMGLDTICANEATKPQRSSNITNNFNQCPYSLDKVGAQPGVGAADDARRLRLKRERAVEHVLHGKRGRVCGGGGFGEHSSAALLYVRAWADSTWSDDGTGRFFDRPPLDHRRPDAITVIATSLRVVFFDNELVPLADAESMYDEVTSWLTYMGYAKQLVHFEKALRNSRVGRAKQAHLRARVCGGGARGAAPSGPDCVPASMRAAAASGALRLRANDD